MRSEEYHSNPAASVPNDACVLVRRRNSRLRIPNVLVARIGFHVAFVTSQNVSRSRPVSSSEWDGPASEQTGGADSTTSDSRV